LWFAKTLADFEINDLAALPPLFRLRRTDLNFLSKPIFASVTRGFQKNMSVPVAV